MCTPQVTSSRSVTEGAQKRNAASRGHGGGRGVPPATTKRHRRRQPARARTSVRVGETRPPRLGRVGIGEPAREGRGGECQPTRQSGAAAKRGGAGGGGWGRGAGDGPATAPARAAERAAAQAAGTRAPPPTEAGTGGCTEATAGAAPAATVTDRDDAAIAAGRHQEDGGDEDVRVGRRADGGDDDSDRIGALQEVKALRPLASTMSTADSNNQNGSATGSLETNPSTAAMKTAAIADAASSPASIAGAIAPASRGGDERGRTLLPPKMQLRKTYQCDLKSGPGMHQVRLSRPSCVTAGGAEGDL